MKSQEDETIIMDQKKAGVESYLMGLCQSVNSFLDTYDFDNADDVLYITCATVEVLSTYLASAAKVYGTKFGDERTEDLTPEALFAAISERRLRQISEIAH